jgi:hypothetical protein
MHLHKFQNHSAPHHNYNARPQKELAAQPPRLLPAVLMAIHETNVVHNEGRRQLSAALLQSQEGHRQQSKRHRRKYNPPTTRANQQLQQARGCTAQAQQAFPKLLQEPLMPEKHPHNHNH